MPAKQRRARFPRLTVRGGMFLAAGAGLLLLALLNDQRDLLFVAGLLLATPVAAVGYVLIRPVRLRATRTLRPHVVPAGGEVVVRLGLRNLSSRPVSGLRLRDTVRRRDTTDLGLTPPAATPLPALDAYEGGPDNGADSVRFEYRFTPPRRGLYATGPVLIGRSDPFGLAAGEWAVGEPQALVVTPRVTVLAGRGLTGAQNDGDVPERLRRLHHNADPLIAREYRPGDPLRRVNWPATARLGEIMVRQEEEQSNPGARIVFDTALRGRGGATTGTGGDTEAGGDGGDGAGRPRLQRAFEVAVELVASVGVHLLAAGYRVDLVALGPNPLGDPPAVFLPPGGAALLLEGLAGVVPVDPNEPGETAEHGVDRARTADGAGLTPEPAASVAPGAPGSGASGTGRTHRAFGGLLPTFAVLVAVDDRDLVDLADLVSQSRPAVAFVLDTVDTDAVRRLREAGWRCIPVHQARDIPRAWEDLIGERRRVHDPA